MLANDPTWLDVVRHRIPGIRVKFLLVVQHHAIAAATRLVAPVSPPLPKDIDILAPRLQIDGTAYRVRLLDMTAVPVRLLGETVASLDTERDAVLDAMDIVLHGYPVGRPH